ncbi:hypothetical protein RUM43_011498 [Polyplax serrata]|uniref:Uncharacterized protein n=1 Tax=Polyplax serrata TaxID=468196 RepID=A0AAN8P920_POLSC
MRGLPVKYPREANTFADEFFDMDTVKRALTKAGTEYLKRWYSFVGYLPGTFPLTPVKKSRHWYQENPRDKDTEEQKGSHGHRIPARRQKDERGEREKYFDEFRVDSIKLYVQSEGYDDLKSFLFFQIVTHPGMHTASSSRTDKSCILHMFIGTKSLSKKGREGEYFQDAGIITGPCRSSNTRSEGDTKTPGIEGKTKLSRALSSNKKKATAEKSTRGNRKPPYLGRPLQAYGGY